MCANEKGYGLCNECDDLVGCTKFDWLGEYSKVLKGNLEGYREMSKEEILAEAQSETS